MPGTTETDIEGFTVNQIDFDYFNLKSKIVFKSNGSEENATALIRIRKDSLIWFNLSGTLGIQGMRGIITKDSVKILDRVNKEFLEYNFNDLSNRFHYTLDYQLIEGMILGNLVVNQSDETVVKNEQNYILKQNRNSVEITNFINLETNKVQKVELVEQNTENFLTLLYQDFQPLGEQIFPNSCNINLIYSQDGQKNETQMTIKHIKAEFPEKLRFPFNIPNKYEKDLNK